MAKIVIGLATSHGPMLSAPPDKWGARVPVDQANSNHHFQERTWTFDELVIARAGEQLSKELGIDVWTKKYKRCRAAIDALAAAWSEAKPDVAIIIGNDQREIFKEGNVPAIAVYWGETIINDDFDQLALANMPAGSAISVRGHTPEGGACYRGAPELGRHLIGELMTGNFDVASVTKTQGDHTPHAFGFIYRQIMKDRVIPNVPVILNTFYPPNQPTISRCISLGTAIAEAVETWNADVRVALVASGGLSHFVIDEKVDQTVLSAIKNKDMRLLDSLSEQIYQAGTSEIKSWVSVASAVTSYGLQPDVIDYVPCYRSEAGTGNAMGFVRWT